MFSLLARWSGSHDPLWLAALLAVLLCSPALVAATVLLRGRPAEGWVRRAFGLSCAALFAVSVLRGGVYFGYDSVEFALYSAAVLSTLWFGVALWARVPKQNWFRDYGESLAVAVWAALAIRATLVEVYSIPSESMVPTLQVRDHLLVSKTTFGWHLPFTKGRVLRFRQPRRGEIVIFVPPHDPKKSFVKRCVGLPGETVEIRGKMLFINGKPMELPTSYGALQSLAPEGERKLRALYEGLRSRRLAELSSKGFSPGDPRGAELIARKEWLGPVEAGGATYNLEASFHHARVYVRLQDAPQGGRLENLPKDFRQPDIWKGLGNKDWFGPYTLKPGEYWLMGDNRDNSSDSRYFGPVPEENLRGTPLFRYWPPSRMGWVR